MREDVASASMAQDAFGPEPRGPQVALRNALPSFLASDSSFGLCWWRLASFSSKYVALPDGMLSSVGYTVHHIATPLDTSADTLRVEYDAS